MLTYKYIASVLLLLLLLSLAATHTHAGHVLDVLARPRNNNADPTQLVYDLINRTIGPGFQNDFLLQIDDNLGKEYFSVNYTKSSSSVIVVLTADSAVNLAQAFNYYLKYTGLCSITWTGDQCSLVPNALPKPEPALIFMASKLRYYLNVCTYGYSTVWWDWARWEREIDWMALNGYNLPLAFVGQEYVWSKVFLQMGLSQANINEWFTGSAFLPWSRMGNLNGWAGNLTTEWIDGQMSLQQQILQRMREYGMFPVLPGFAGHVPPGLSALYPTASITVLDEWCNFPGTFFLDPVDPLFAKISQTFLQIQNETYGTDHFYNFDPFNELTPPSSDTSYLHNASSLMFDAIKAVDADAIWVLQGWFLVNEDWWWKPAQTQAFLSGVPVGSLLVLDLWAEVRPAWNLTDQFYGHYWIWCMLHNFGGRPGMYGELPTIATAPIAAREVAPKMIGTGLTPEAIEQNVIMYDLMSEMAWRQTAPDLTQWVNDYITRRYGVAIPALQTQWNVLARTVYNASGIVQQVPLSLVTQRPALNFTNDNYYDPQIVIGAWIALLQVTDKDVLNSQTYQFDLVELTQQALSNYFLQSELLLNSAYYQKDTKSFDKLTIDLRNAIKSMDEISMTQELLLLGHWTSDARSWAADVHNPADTAPYEFNARNQVTLWGPNGGTWNHDYACKWWNGLIGEFYSMRWQFFLGMMQQSLVHDLPFDTDTYTSKILQLEYQWNLQTNVYPYIPEGNAFEISKTIFDQMFK
ncbi:hypothetical protein SAMD00019534_090250 [Acytostelium subglobosum LB1]|uniref:hypothetical protein n=1 Tax=Acytostelium subglobosum LB1 TaxID=1410327 RepID=UPI000644D813|nr:hypothetical protein SAMD00019534_090250 [Acytostelium subglobosum LB1]GAM25850.1 hypothetical protein SAMD00019534_090250 [Acytostelium subglobosum LB1]|eukprot:XP_012751368.1 hypothetical protein SAMD00019534_090250 [Acytostelium subglobosum LB1]